MRQHAAIGCAQDRVEHARPGNGGIFAQTKARRIGRAAGSPDFDRLASDDHAIGVDRAAEMAVDQRHRHMLAGQHQPQRFGEFGEHEAVRLSQGQPAHAISVQLVDQRRDDAVELIEAGGRGGTGAIAALAPREERADVALAEAAAAGRAKQDRQEQLVAKEPVGKQPLAVALVEFARESA